MWRCAACLVVLLNIIEGGGTTKNTDAAAGLWVDDFAALGQYGKTSDKHLYGKTAPPSRTRMYNLKKPTTQTPNIDLLGLQSLESTAISHQESFLFNNPYHIDLSKQPHTQKSPKFTPLNDEYYTKYLQALTKDQALKYSSNNFVDFKPVNHKYSDALSPHKSIQDVLDSKDVYQRNKGELKNNKYLNFRNTDLPRRKPNVKPKYSQDLIRYNNRCTSGNCKRGLTSTYYSRPSRPLMRKIKNRFINDYIY